MTKAEAFTFLKTHQPLPDDKDLTDAIIDRYDEVRAFFLKNPDEACIPLFLQSFGEGDGLGVYQLIEDNIRLYSKEAVLPHLMEALQSDKENIVYWNLQIAVDFPDAALIPFLEKWVSSPNPDIRFFAVAALSFIPSEAAIFLLKKIQRIETDEQISGLLKDIFTEQLSTNNPKTNMQTIKNIILEGKHNKPILTDLFYKKNNSPKPIVIFSHGFKGFKDWGHWDVVGQAFAEAGMVFVKFNFSHNGTTVDAPLDFGDLEAFGNNNFSIELDDLGVVIDWICGGEVPIEASEINTDELYLIGHSRGGGTTILKAAEDARVKKIVTWAAVNDFGKRWVGGLTDAWKETGVIHIMNGRTKQEMPLYWQLAENYFANKDRLHIPAAVQKLTIPFLIVHGTKDPAVSHAEALQIHAWNPTSTLLSIEGGDHVFGGRHPWTEVTLPADMTTVVKESIAFLKG